MRTIRRACWPPDTRGFDFSKTNPRNSLNLKSNQVGSRQRTKSLTHRSLSTFAPDFGAKSARIEPNGMTPSITSPMHGIRDNHSRGSVADFLKIRVSEGSILSVVSAYFTIHAYQALRSNLDGIESLRFLFGEPRFIGSLDPEKTERKRFSIEEDGLELANRLRQRQVAFDCAQWIKEKVKIRSVLDANFVHGKMYHVDDGRREHAIVGSSNFTRRGLGISTTPNIELRGNIKTAF